MVNTIVLTKEKLGNELFKVMGETLEILMKLEYVCKVRADEPGLGIYVIEYEYDDPQMATYELIWFNEEKQVLLDREEDE